MVAELRQRALGVRRARADDAPRGEHQRPPDRRRRSPHLRVPPSIRARRGATGALTELSPGTMKSARRGVSIGLDVWHHGMDLLRPRPHADLLMTIDDRELKARQRAMWALGDYHKFATHSIWRLGAELVAACGISAGQRV